MTYEDIGHHVASGNVRCWWIGDRLRGFDVTAPDEATEARHARSAMRDDAIASGRLELDRGVGSVRVESDLDVLPVLDELETFHPGVRWYVFPADVPSRAAAA